MSAYQLTREDIDLVDDDPPSIRAARNPDPAVLTAILVEYNHRISKLPTNPKRHHIFPIDYSFSVNTQVSGAIHGMYVSPLTEAITANLPKNVAIILDAGADPNGIRLGDLDEYSVRYIRGRDPKYDTYSYCMAPPRSKVIPNVSVQTAPLTSEEIVARHKVFSRFWTEPELPTARFRSKPARTALETAAYVGDIALFDQVRAAHPDESWWVLPDPRPVQLPDNLTHSTLTTSSPIHEAIKARKQDMLTHLLSLGYSPNVSPLAAPTVCLTPHMMAIAFCNPPNLDAYDILARYPKTDLTLRTPVFSVHILHFAAARLDIELIQRLASHPMTPLGSAGSTALGHTLLHIACLPLTDKLVNLFSPKIYHSVHDVRTLDIRGSWLPIDLLRKNPANRGIFHAKSDTMPLPQTQLETPEDEADRKIQANMVLWLLDSGTQDLAAKDIYGNTALHYLASMARQENLILQVRGKDGGETVWNESENEHGYTPRQLWEDNQTAVIEEWKKFWSE